jgi:hypothetical protein
MIILHDERGEAGFLAKNKPSNWRKCGGPAFIEVSGIQSPNTRF